MLKDLQPIKIPITLGGNDTYLRYNNHSRAYLEHYYPDYNEFMCQDTDSMKITDLMHLLRAGLIDSCYAENEKYLDSFEYDKVHPRMSALGKILTEDSKIDIIKAIVEAFVASIPVAPVGSANFQKGGAV